MDDFQARTRFLLGQEAVARLQQSKVCIFGIGGVGSFVTEALARAGIGAFVLVDGDSINVTNINRQIHATTKTLGRPKVHVMKERILEINPEARVEAVNKYLLAPEEEEAALSGAGYIVDAVDTITSKVDIVLAAKNRGIPVISAMGAANKLEPARFEVADIYETSVDPISRVMRKSLRAAGVEFLKVVYSKEIPLKAKSSGQDMGGRLPLGSVSFVPSAMGLIIAGEVVKDIINK